MATCVALPLLCAALLLLSTPALGASGLGFHSDVHATAAGQGEEGAGGFRLFSRGQLPPLLLLDWLEDFHVHLGSDGHLRAQPLTSSNPNSTWWPGRMLLGKKVRQLSSNGSVTEVSLLAKVKAIRPLDKRLLRIELERDRNMDPIRSGVVQMQFSPPDPPLPAGHGDLGDLHDLLRGSEVMESTVTLHSDRVLLMTSAESAEPTVVSGAAAAAAEAEAGLHSADSADLLLKLTDARETHRVHPSLKIQVVEDESSTGRNCYTSVTTVQVTTSGTLEVRAGSEIGVQGRHLVSSRPSRHLHRLPLALPSSGPPLHLVTSYSSATWLDVYVTTSGPLHLRGGYNASGNVIIESSVCDGALPRSTLNFTGWSAVISPWQGRSLAHFSLQVSLHNEVRYQSSLQWGGVPEPVKSLPALVLSLKPQVRSSSVRTAGREEKEEEKEEEEEEEEEEATCVQADLALGAELRLEEEDPRGVAVLLAGGRGLRGVAVLEKQLLRQCSAPCPEDTPTPPRVSMATACGVPSARISREDPDFQRLAVVQGDELEFRGEEGAASSWCGAPGQPCPPCHPPSPQAPPCADRVMSPDAARLLSRLARLARLEWPQRRVVVEEAWDEPDGLHPLGRHGNRSLHYEGRALQLTLSSSPEASELRRLAQLAVCAGFPFADVTSSTVEVCTAASQSEEASRHRRSLPSSSSTIHQLKFQKFMESIEAESLPPSPPPAAPLSVGQSHPPGSSLQQVLGPALTPGSRQEPLYQYLFHDVVFPPEGPSATPLTPRMALRLRRLAALVRQKSAEVEKERILASPPTWLTALRESTRTAVEEQDYEFPEDGLEPLSRAKRKAVNVAKFRSIDFWADHTVSYEFHKSVGEDQKVKIKKAMAEWEKYTCLTFVENATAEFRTLFLYNFDPAGWCQSSVGRRVKPVDKKGKPHYQWIHFNETCFKHGTIVHEIGHTLGWFHEHQRPDSPKYINLTSRVQDKSNYKPLPAKYVNTYGVPYDYMSIMHYPNRSIITKDKLFRGEIGQRIGLSFMDIKLANLMYECSAHCNASARQSCKGSHQYLDKDCTCWCSPPAGIPYDVTQPRRQCESVIIEKADDKSSSDNALRGGSLRVRLPPDSPLDGSQLSALALQAGFDYVTRTDVTSLQVFVKRQEGYLARLVPYQSTSLLAVQSPAADYDLAPPGGTSARARRAAPLEGGEGGELPLLDGHDRSLPLSAHFRVGDFAHPDHRFFRLDPALLDCLELGAQELGAPPRVEAGWAYRPASVQRLNLGSLPLEEREGFPQGRAVLLKPPTDGDVQEKLKKMALALLGRCTPLMLRVNRKVGFGCHGDKLYVDVRAKTSGDADQRRYAQVWDAGNPALHRALASALHDMAAGGPVIAPTSESRACREPFLGEQAAYFSFSTSLFCLDFSSPCQATLQRRTEVANNLTADLSAVLGRVLSPSTISQAVRECLVSHCGGCLGAGDVWKEKVRACVKLVRLFSEHASSPWGGGREGAAFLNSHRPQSLLHGLACSSGSLCLENTQLHSLAQPALQARYRPEPGKSREELLYSGEDNASPLLEVIQQEMARSVQGKVKVFIEQEGDLGVLKDTLKVLMIHNKEVTEVEFHFLDAELRDRVLPRLQRHLEGWALRACPRWSRFAAAPFSSHVIPPSRQKRSAELSRERNEARLALRSWEQDWLLKI